MSEYVRQLLIICPLLFLAGFADSIAGGGGTISLPALLLAGLPTRFALGTNKLCMSLGTAASVFKYGKSGMIRWKKSLFAAAGALLGAMLGAKIALLLNEQFMNYVLMVLLPAAAIFLTVNRGFGAVQRVRDYTEKKLLLLAVLCGFGVGLYDGFFGPGAGTFYIMALCLVLGTELTEAAADSKVMNLASNAGALITFVLGGVVIYKLALPGALCTIAGNYLGSTLAIKNGSKFIRPIMAVMILLLLVKTALQFFGA